MDYGLLRGTDGTGPAVLAHIQSNRSIGSSVIDVDSLDNWPTKFIVTTGTINASGFLDPATITEMSAHQSGGDIIIDGFEPGFSDLGNTNTQVAVIKPTGGIINRIVDLALVSHKVDGTIKDDAISSADMFADSVDPVKRASELMFDHVASGCVITADAAGSTRNWSMSAGVAYINGKRVVVPAIVADAATANSDTYIDVNDSGVVLRTGGNIVSNNAASPALAANSIRLGIVVAGATSIASAASINQGQEDRGAPVVSSLPLAVTDSLGNLICPRDPQRRTLGYRQSSTNQASISAQVLVTGLSAAVKVPTGRKVVIEAEVPNVASSAVASAFLAIYNSATITGSAIQNTKKVLAISGAGEMVRVKLEYTPAAGTNSYCIGISVDTGSGSTSLAANALAWMRIGLA